MTNAHRRKISSITVGVNDAQNTRPVRVGSNSLRAVFAAASGGCAKYPLYLKLGAGGGYR